MNRMLIIDDDKLFGETLKENMEDHGLEVHYIQDPIKTKWQEINPDIDIILLDLRLQNFSGLNLIEDLRDKWPKSFIIMMTGFGTIATAVDAIKKGANEYITKPITYKKLTVVLSKDHDATVTIQEEVMSLDRVEREYIEHILTQENGNITKAAEKLGLHRQSLQRKLKKWVPFK